MLAPSPISRTALLQKFTAVRELTEQICLPLQPEDTVVQPMVDVSPPKWHMAHTTWFFETFILKEHLPGYKLFHKDYGYLFNSYYNSIGNRVLRHNRGTLTRPPLAEVLAYRVHVNESMARFLETADDGKLEKLLPVLELGMQHEQQHQELLVTDIKYILSTNPLLPAYLPEEAYSIPNEAYAVPDSTYLEIPGGIYHIGYKGKNFCFDNELAEHKVYLDDCRIQNRLVTNKEYLEFIEDGGYSDFRFWLDEGWALVKQNQWEAPLYWIKQDAAWHRFTLHGLQPLNLNAPVTHISFYEANAFASWAQKRLLTEFEWEAATQLFQPEAATENFLDDFVLDPLPLPGQISATTCHQLLGSTWEWTYSAYHPYPGFKKAEGAIGEYNGKFMINQMVLRGGSCATPLNHIRTTYRNFFHPDKRWQFTGIRLADK
ncbi:MAG: ergothioneine biosynthesis protein EgtB [Hymenobacteraceae bacterium]|nr:ergothioneine biosynthesis protein EgtB [Hymenobacteraceae bacterium]